MVLRDWWSGKIRADRNYLESAVLAQIKKDQSAAGYEGMVEEIKVRTMEYLAV